MSLSPATWEGTLPGAEQLLAVVVDHDGLERAEAASEVRCLVTVEGSVEAFDALPLVWGW
jgi:hypothetical protein